MVPESPLKPTEHGLVPESDGWFVLNAREAPWRPAEGRGAICIFEGEPEFSQLGVNLGSSSLARRWRCTTGKPIRRTS